MTKKKEHDDVGPGIVGEPALENGLKMGRPELPPFAEVIDMVAAGTKKLIEAGMGGADAGRVAEEVLFRWMDYR